VRHKPVPHCRVHVEDAKQVMRPALDVDVWRILTVYSAAPIHEPDRSVLLAGNGKQDNNKVQGK